MSLLHNLMLSLPARYRPENFNAEDEKIFHFYFSGDEAGNYSVVLKEDVCQVFDYLTESCNCKVNISAEDFLALESGTLDAKIAFMTGKLRVSNLFEILHFVSCFKLLNR